MFEPDRQQSRQMFFNAWKKHKEKQVLEPLESLLVEIINLHPEYHRMLNNPDSTLDRDYLPESGETNPFLHMGLHIAIREQVSIDQPAGIRQHYQALLIKYQDVHTVEHKIMDCLVEMVWNSQKYNQLPDTATYLNCISSL